MITTSEIQPPPRPLYVGANVTRPGDDKLLRGQETFVADVRPAGTVEMVIVRSPYAHAGIVSIDTAEARALPGVIAVWTAADLHGVAPFPDLSAMAAPVAMLPLATTRVRYVGMPVAAVVAEDRYLAEDAAELVEIDYSPLTAITSIEQALDLDSPRLFDGWDSNRLVHLDVSVPAVDEAFEAADSTFKRRYRVGRHTAMPIETRATVADFDGSRLHVWASNQSPHMMRTALSYALPIEEADIRVTAPAVGGGFGQKQHNYPEDVLACWASMQLRRPVRHNEDRAEHMLASTHSRDQLVDVEAAVGRDGVIEAIRGHIYHDLGSGEAWPGGFCPSLVTLGHMTGPYRIDLAAVGVTAVVTNKTPSGSYRGYGIPEACFVLERFIDDIAAAGGHDRLEMRRKMLLDQSDFPYRTAGGAYLDSGTYRECFERIVELAEARFAEHVADAGAGELIGVGYATYREGTAPTHYNVAGHWTGYESCRIEIDPSGTALVSSGMTDQGQGTHTFVQTLTADALALGLEQVRVRLGDTDLCPYGLGAWGSRQAAVGAGAILDAAATIRDKASAIAAHMLEANPDDVVLDDDGFHVRGSPSPSVSWQRIGTAATIRTIDLPEGMEPGLAASARYEPEVLEHEVNEDGGINAAAAWVNATHAAIVRVDGTTGAVEILDFLVAHDCGPMINPPIVHGQILGGVAQGIGGTLYEDLAYGEDGQPRTAFMDYLVPTSAEIPSVTVEHFGSDSELTPLGIKGVGEGGTVGPPAAIANAVAHALAGYQPDVWETPLTPERVLRMMGKLD